MISLHKKRYLKRKKQGYFKGYQQRNRKRIRKYQREWRERNRDKQSSLHKKWYRRNKKKVYQNTRKNYLLRKYKITLKEYNRLFKKQKGKCWICKRKQRLNRKLCVDHNHRNKKNRFLLCYRCNSGIGMFNENIVFLKRAIKYILACRKK